jgi:hypothetical protein
MAETTKKCPKPGCGGTMEWSGYPPYIFWLCQDCGYKEPIKKK